MPADAKFDVIVSNPPYVKRTELPTLQREVQAEPKLALDGGLDGLDLVKRVITDAMPRLKPGALLALEIGEDQGDAVKQLLTRAGGHDARIDKDLERHDRIALARKES